MKRISIVIACLVIMSFGLPVKKKITIWLAGDSTMSVKEKKVYPETGWGMPFANDWDSTVTIVNKARNGRSTQSFVDEGLWKQITDSLQEDDYVLIQFGHNDEVPSKKTYTTPEQFKNNLIKFVTEVRSKKGIPVLLTPMARRKFDSTGKVEDTHKEYSAIVREVANVQKVILFDMNTLTMGLYKEAGVEYSKSFFLHFKPGEQPNYPDGKEDNTHFSVLGAEWVAGIVLSQIKDRIPLLAERIKR